MNKFTAGTMAMALLFFAAPVYAQHQSASADKMAAKMQSQLNLTQNQVNAIKPILQDALSKRQQIWQSMKNGGDRSAMRSQMQQVKESERQALAQVLTPDQMTQWQNMQSQHQGHRHHRE